MIDKNGQQHLYTMYFAVNEFEKKNNFTFEEEEKRFIATILLQIADKIQMRITGLNNPNYKEYSHTTSRQILFNMIEDEFPITEELKEKENVKNWANNILKKSYNLIDWVQS